MSLNLPFHYLCFGIVLLTSCKYSADRISSIPKHKSKIEQETSSVLSPVSNPVDIRKTDIGFVNEQKLFLGYQVGMSELEFQFRTDSLIKSKKIFRNHLMLIYPVSVVTNSFEIQFRSPDDHPIAAKHATIQVVLQPEFWHSKLIALRLTAEDDTTSLCYSHFSHMLNKRYYNAKENLANLSFIEDLALGEKASSFKTTKWIWGDVDITLKHIANFQGIGDNKISGKITTFLSYVSRSYADRKSEAIISSSQNLKKELSTDF